MLVEPHAVCLGHYTVSERDIVFQARHRLLKLSLFSIRSVLIITVSLATEDSRIGICVSLLVVMFVKNRGTIFRRVSKRYCFQVIGGSQLAEHLGRLPCIYRLKSYVA